MIIYEYTIVLVRAFQRRQKLNPQNQPKHHSPRTTKGNCLLDGFATCHGNTEAQLKMTVKEYTIYCAYMLQNHI